jgi:hypothetical protein
MFHVCCNNISKMFHFVSVLCCIKWFHVASCKSRCFVCFTHILQVCVLNVFSCCKCFMLYGRRWADWVMLRSGHARACSSFSCSSWLLSTTRAERERGGGQGWPRAQRQGEVRAWGRTKADGVKMKADRGGLQTDIRALPTRNYNTRQTGGMQKYSFCSLQRINTCSIHPKL